MQWLQDPSQSNIDNLNNLRREGNRHFRNNKMEYLKAKIDELVTKIMIKKYQRLLQSFHKFKMVTSLELI